MKTKIFIPVMLIGTVCCFLLTISATLAGTFTDNFNDNTPNTGFWTPFVAYDTSNGDEHGVNIAETNQQLQVTVLQDHTEGYYAGYKTLHPLAGDFDMQVDFYHLNDRPSGYPYWFGTRMGMSFDFGGGNYANVHYVEYWDSPQVMFDAKAGGYHVGGSSASSDYSHGRLRFVRTGDRLEGFAWDWVGNTWYSVGWGQDPLFANPATLDLMVWDGAVHTTWNGTSAAYMAFDDFQVSGPNINPVPEVSAPSTYAWHTFYGSSGDNEGGARIAVDSSGNTYITGSSNATWNGPAGQAPLHAHSGGRTDLFVLKLSSTGAYQWHTFYGDGSGWVGGSQGTAIALDDSRNVYITGQSSGSWTGPSGESPIHAYDGYGADILVLKLDTDGAYQWHTYDGGGSNESGYAIAVSGGNVYVTGVGNTPWLGPSGEPPLHPYAGGHVPFVVLKLDTNGAYQWHTFYGSDYSSSHAIAVDGSGNVYVTGDSDGPWYGPSAENPLNPWAGVCCWNASRDIFVLKLGTNGAYQWHTFYASADHDNVGLGIALDSSRNVYVTGQSFVSWNGPSGQSPLNPFGTSGAYYDLFVLKLDTNGGYYWHTFYGGGAGQNIGNSIAVDIRGNVYVTGHTDSFDHWNGPSGQLPLYAYTGGTLVLKLDTDGAYKWHTFCGQNGDDGGAGIAVDHNRNIYVTGASYPGWNGPSGQAPLHAYSGSWDIFVLKMAQVTNLTVVRHTDNTLWAMTCEGTSSCSAWTPMTGKFSVQPTLTWDPAIQKYILIGIGNNQTSIWRSTFEAKGSFNNDWTLITGASPSPVAVAGGGFNMPAPQTITNLTVVRHTDNTLWSMACEGTSSCSAWAPITGKFSVQPTLTWDPALQKYILIGIGNNQTSIWRSTFEANGSFNNDWTLITGASPSPVAVAGGGFNMPAPPSITNLTVVRHTDNTLWSMTCEGASSCSAWAPMTGKFAVQPTLTWDPAIQKYILIGIGNNQTSIWRGTFEANGSFNSDWTLITGTSPSPVAVAGGGF